MMLVFQQALLIGDEFYAESKENQFSGFGSGIMGIDCAVYFACYWS
jgi:hypothetical protein